MTKREINYNCTTAYMAEQIGIKLWQAMEMGKYFKNQALTALDERDLTEEEMASIIFLSNRAEGGSRTLAKTIIKAREDKRK